MGKELRRVKGRRISRKGRFVNSFQIVKIGGRKNGSVDRDKFYGLLIEEKTGGGKGEAAWGG